MEIKRIYHNYKLWEDYKNGFYSSCEKSKKQENIDKVIEMFNNYELTSIYMQKVIDEWKYSCEHNFTNYSMNARSRDAFATTYGLTRPDPNNAGQVITMTKAQNRQYRIKEFIKEITKAEEKKVALAAVADPTIQD